MCVCVCVCVCVCARARARIRALTQCLTLATSWTVACQAPLSSGFSRREDWSELPFLFQDIFLIRGSNPSLVSPVLASGFFTTAQPGKPLTPLLDTSRLPIGFPGGSSVKNLPEIQETQLMMV